MSEACKKEVSLADMLRKPIIPIQLERTPWPPPGPLALIMAQHIYVDLAGILEKFSSKYTVWKITNFPSIFILGTGGHGGCGKEADWGSKVRELIRRLRLYTTQHQSPEHRKSMAKDNHDFLEAIEVAPVGGAVQEPSISPNFTESLEVSNDETTPTWGQADLSRVPCCINALSFPSCTIL